MNDHHTTLFSHMTILDDPFTLVDGIEMEIKCCLPVSNVFHHFLPPLIFLHGSFHSAWCWAEYFMPYFARIGYPCIALSLRGTYKTSAGLVNKVKIDQHVEDVLYLLEYMHKQIFEEENNGKCDDTLRLFFRYISASISSKDDYIAPVLIAHSFGGLTCMKLLERLDKESTKQRPLLSTIALLCSVPPSGITKMSMRALKRNPLKGWRIMKGLAMKKAVSDAKLCRMLFFDQEVSNDDMDKYMTHFQEDSKVTLDLRDLADKLPALDTDSNGCSTCIKNGVLQYQALVLGGTEDFIVDSYAVKETARYLCANNSAIDKKSRCKLVMVKGAVHDVMLANCWMDVAKELELWLSNIVRIAESSHLTQ